MKLPTLSEERFATSHLGVEQLLVAIHGDARLDKIEKEKTKTWEDAQGVKLVRSCAGVVRKNSRWN